MNDATDGLYQAEIQHDEFSSMYACQVDRMMEYTIDYAFLSSVRDAEAIL